MNLSNKKDIILKNASNCILTYPTICPTIGVHHTVEVKYVSLSGNLNQAGIDKQMFNIDTLKIIGKGMGTLESYKVIMIDGIKSAELIFKTSYQSAPGLIKMKGACYMISYEKKVIYITYNVGGKTETQMNSLFEIYLPLFRQLVNQTKFLDHYVN